MVVVWLSTEELVILFWSPWKNTKSKPMPLLSLPLAAANPIYSEVCFSFSLSIAQSLGLLEEKPKPQKLIPSKSLQSFVRLLQKVFFFPFYLLRCSFPLNSSLLLSPFSPLSNFVKLEFFVSRTFYLYFPFISSIFLVRFGSNSVSLWLLQKLGPFEGVGTL